MLIFDNFLLRLREPFTRRDAFDPDKHHKIPFHAVYVPLTASNGLGLQLIHSQQHREILFIQSPRLKKSHAQRC
jgi:hypothetical protein